jgi:PHP family Zn ribbon phosphoesterase
VDGFIGGFVGNISNIKMSTCGFCLTEDMWNRFVGKGGSEIKVVGTIDEDAKEKLKIKISEVIEKYIKR